MTTAPLTLRRPGGYPHAGHPPSEPRHRARGLQGCNTWAVHWRAPSWAHGVARAPSPSPFPRPPVTPVPSQAPQQQGEQPGSEPGAEQSPSPRALALPTHRPPGPLGPQTVRLQSPEPHRHRPGLAAHPPACSSSLQDGTHTRLPGPAHRARGAKALTGAPGRALRVPPGPWRHRRSLVTPPARPRAGASGGRRSLGHSACEHTSMATEAAGLGPPPSADAEQGPRRQGGGGAAPGRGRARRWGQSNGGG